MDVNSLYTSIPHTKGINACRSFVNWHLTDPVLVNDIPILIDFILKHSLFKFNNYHYLQIRGTFMGTKMGAATSANIFMDSIETLFLSASTLIPGIYCCYMYDIFLISPHGNDTSTHFLENANNTHPNMKFTHEFSKTTQFLDVFVQMRHEKILPTLHKKPTDSHSYLHYTSCHTVDI